MHKRHRIIAPFLMPIKRLAECCKIGDNYKSVENGNLEKRAYCPQCSSLIVVAEGCAFDLNVDALLIPVSMLLPVSKRLGLVLSHLRQLDWQPMGL